MKNYYTETDNMVQALLNEYERSYPATVGSLQVRLGAMLFQLEREFGKEVAEKALQFLK